MKAGPQLKPSPYSRFRLQTHPGSSHCLHSTSVSHFPISYWSGEKSLPQALEQIINLFVRLPCFFQKYLVYTVCPTPNSLPFQFQMYHGPLHSKHWQCSFSHPATTTRICKHSYNRAQELWVLCALHLYFWTPNVFTREHRIEWRTCKKKKKATYVNGVWVFSGWGKHSSKWCFSLTFIFLKPFLVESNSGAYQSFPGGIERFPFYIP
jgi:hypothetical protein